MIEQLTLGSLFAGIGGFDLAAERAGMEVKWQSQWEPPRWGWNTIAKKIKNRKVKAGLRANPKFGRWIDDPQKPSLVLDHHFPDIPNYGDIHEVRNPPAVDILCGGFPCQDYSVAGARDGLAGDRGALWWEFHRLIDEVRPTWVVGENVPGLLSSRGGQDFETIIGSLTELGYGVAWAVLDAQYFGVAQRRRRVFIVGHSGGVPRPEVLALGEGVFGHPAPRREARQGASSGTPVGIGGGDLSPSVTSSTGGLSAKQNQHAFVVHGFSSKDHGQDAAEDLAPTLRSMSHQNSHVNGGGQAAVAFAQNQRDELRDLDDLAGSLAAEPGMKQQTYVLHYSHDYNQDRIYDTAGPSEALTVVRRPNFLVKSAVRRLTPLECERLQGFPDGWTDIPGNSDTQRYKQLGNAVAVPVAEWIFRRIVASESGRIL